MPQQRFGDGPDVWPVPIDSLIDDLPERLSVISSPPQCIARCDSRHRAICLRTSIARLAVSRPHVNLDPHFQQIFFTMETLRVPSTSIQFLKPEDIPAAQMLVPVRSTQRDRGG
jgi:hypothetical protein